MACSVDRIRSGLAMLALCMGSSPMFAVRAQEPLPIAVFPSASSDPRWGEIAAALDSTVFASVSALPDVHVTARPAIDLSATELALGCTGEGRQCLSMVLREARAQALIAPSVKGDGEALLVTFTYFAARDDEPLRTVVRRYAGKNLERRALDAVPDMLRELLRLRPRTGDAADHSVTAPAALAASPAQPRVSAIPIALAAAGIALVGIGAGFGLAARASEDEYRRLEPDTMIDIDGAHSQLDTAEDQARLANVGFGMGAAAIAAGALWLAIDLSTSPDRSETVVSAKAGPGQAGLFIRGPLGSRTW